LYTERQEIKEKGGDIQLFCVTFDP